MVRTEVSNLERSYGDNERRIRALVEGLASEREAVVLNAERVRTALVHRQVGVRPVQLVSELVDRDGAFGGLRGGKPGKPLGHAGDVAGVVASFYNMATR